MFTLGHPSSFTAARRRTLRVWGLVAAGVWLTLAAPAARAAQAPVPPAPMKGPVDVSAVGPQVGQQVPEFRLTDQAGQVWTRESIAGPKGAMLVFFRSADW